MVMYKMSSYILPAGMNYLRKVKLETQRELVHNRHPVGPQLIRTVQQLGHRRIPDRSLSDVAIHRAVTDRLTKCTVTGVSPPRSYLKLLISYLKTWCTKWCNRLFNLIGCSTYYRVYRPARVGLYLEGN